MLVGTPAQEERELWRVLKIDGQSQSELITAKALVQLDDQKPDEPLQEVMLLEQNPELTKSPRQ